ncbi:MAG: hypothetical protein II992_00795 [Lachnospiraceae bacterium]|nr:hypothetical protein [Lachnospiraceae bacterium]
MLRLDHKFTKITYFFFVFSWLLGDYSGNRNDDYKYAFWIMSFILAIFPIIYYALGYKKMEKKWDNYTLKQILIVVGVFAMISICAMPINGFHLLMWKDLYYILMPALYVFAIINLDDNNSLDYYVNLIFFTYVAYFVYVFGISSFTPANFARISFPESYSPWESGMADIFAICFFYYYTRKKWGCCLIAGLLNFMSFKRLHLFFMAFYIVAKPFLKNKPVPKLIEWGCKIGLILSPLFIYAATSENFANWFEITFHMNLNSFTSGRFNQINLINGLSENMTGLGMTHLMLVKYGFPVKRLHCDILRFLIETTVIGLVVFVNSYLNIAKRNQKNFSLIMFFMIIMVSSTCIENTFYWMLIFLVMEGIQRDSHREEISHGKELSKG